MNLKTGTEPEESISSCVLLNTIPSCTILRGILTENFSYDNNKKKAARRQPFLNQLRTGLVDDGRAKVCRGFHS